MAAKLREKDGFYWVVVHHEGQRKWKKIGQDKREAQKVVHRVNAQLALGTFTMRGPRATPTVAQALQSWYEDYRPTFSVSYAQQVELNNRLHLVPMMGHLLISEVTERDLLRFIDAKTAPGIHRPLKVGTLLNVLSMLGRVLTLAVESGELEKNPCRNLKRLLNRVERQQTEEVSQVDAWSRAEIVKLLAIAEESEPSFYPLLVFLLSTGARKGEALGLKWADIDFDSSHIHIRRALVRGRQGPPKSGKARFVAISDDLGQVLRDLLQQRRRECLERGWPQVPEQVFCSQAGTPLDERNVNRVWDRIRRKAQKQAVRPLRLHDCRHTWATLALESGKNIRWVSDQLGHADPAFTLRTYTHVLKQSETDLSFVEFSTFSGGTKRHPRGTEPRRAQLARAAPRATTRRSMGNVARREGLEPPTLRFEA